MCPSKVADGGERGWIVPIGGAENKEDNPRILKRFPDLCGGSDAEIVVIPLTGWLAAVFSPRRYLLGTTFAFLAASVACAWAWDLNSLIAFRVVQGFTGGAMIPMALTLVLRLLPERHHAAGLPRR